MHSWFCFFSLLSCFSWFDNSYSFVCIRGSDFSHYFRAFRAFRGLIFLLLFVSIRVHSWFSLSPLLIFVPFVPFVVKSFFCHSCPFVSIRGSDFSHYFRAFRGLIIRIHSWFDISVRPVLRRALGEPTAANPVEGLTLWGVIRNPSRLALPTPPFNSPWQFPVPNILVRNSCATPG